MKNAPYITRDVSYSSCSSSSGKRRPVRELSADVARKIAAGEVIDRPASIVRELMDNAVDSGASSIAVEITGGGIDCIRVIDNGSGMTREDLSACARPHATSKIATEDDLLNLRTLGFRGEALSSIAAVARLTIRSGSFQMRASLTEDHIITPAQPVTGTIVQSESLFENIPARRYFLKRPASESGLCRTTFIEKTLPRPDISFRFSVDGEQRLDLPAGQSLTERFLQALDIRDNSSLFYELKGSSVSDNNNQTGTPDWSFHLVIGDPSVSRTDRKFLYIFVNGRRIIEYPLMQAIEYGCQGYFPNGTHPVAALFVEMNPSLVDFNIHPAKKEARFQDISALHHALSTSVRDFLHQFTVLTMKKTQTESAAEQLSSLFSGETEESFTGTAVIPETEPDTYDTITDKRPESGPDTDFRSHFFPKKEYPQKTTSSMNEEKSWSVTSYLVNHSPLTAAAVAQSDSLKTADKGFHFIGSALGVFLIAEKDNSLYIIDQHAAHERILYNRIMENQGKRQQLLIPYTVYTAGNADDTYLESIKDKLNEAGFSAAERGNGKWEFSSIPERWQGTEEDLTHALLDKHLEPEEIISSLAAMSACKAAVKDGYILDSKTASELAEAALALPDPHCPHGRPVYTVLSREQLYQMVKRT